MGVCAPLRIGTKTNRQTVDGMVAPKNPQRRLPVTNRKLKRVVVVSIDSIMIFGNLFGPRYGGQMNRWIRFQQSMNRKRWFELDSERNSPIALFDFFDLNDAVDAALIDEGSKKDGWRISDDSVIGGYSRATFELVRTREDYKRIMRGEPPLPFLDQIQNKETSTSDEEPTDFVPFVRWKGTIDTTIDERSDVQRSGFCAIRSPDFPYAGADLGGRYNALEITCRSDGRPYSVNLKVDSFIPDDIYQCFLKIPPTIELGSEICPETGGRFDQVVLLFQHFVVTAGGRLRSRQRELDGTIRLQSIGLTLMDGADGDFQFDLARIRAVNYDERGVIERTD